MHYHLAPFVGGGTTEDPFRGTDQPNHAIVDLRPDSTVLLGRCLLATPQREQRAGVFYLGDDLDAASVASRNGIASRLGLTFRTTQPDLRRMVWELLAEHGRQDRTRWNPLRAGKDGVGRVYLGELLREERFGSPRTASITITESFNKANSGTLGPDLSWTELAGNIDVVSNRAQSTGTGDFIARAGTPLDTDDHYAQAVVGSSVADAYVGVMVRRDSGATNTQYEVEALFGSGRIQLAKRVAGAYTVLTNPLEAFSVGTTYTVKASVDGSTLKGYKDGVEKASATDTAIVNNLYTGLKGYYGSGGQFVHWDSFQAGDIVAVVTKFVPWITEGVA